ncbi:hypothetical protein GA0074694_2894 [Micromonospora inyonensis]|uniref:Uncharacterized protein n=1 Tax=Micromonospora inyonensis TaxID=47866 RepID=A0A1C6RSJ9_9ACTN|nr:hypothetical protein GA0074694_2894 [Micromonospora inyonensis]
MSGQEDTVSPQVSLVDPGTPPDLPCRRVPPTSYRCACGRLRERCVRLAVRALWAPIRIAPTRA